MDMTPEDRGLIQDTINAVFGPGNATNPNQSMSPGKRSNAYSHQKILRCIAVLGDQILDEGEPTGTYTWKLAMRDPITGEFVPGTVGDEKMLGPAVLLPKSKHNEVGTPGLIYEVQSSGGGSQKFLFVPFRPGEVVSYLITANAAGKGKYFIKIIDDKSGNVSAGTDLSESDFATLPDEPDGLLLNLKELSNSATGHDLTAAANSGAFSLYGMGRVAGINSDGTRVVHANEFWAGC